MSGIEKVNLMSEPAKRVRLYRVVVSKPGSVVGHVFNVYTYHQELKAECEELRLEIVGKTLGDIYAQAQRAIVSNKDQKHERKNEK